MVYILSFVTDTLSTDEMSLYRSVLFISDRFF